MATPFYGTQQSSSQGTQQAAGSQQSTSFIPNYSETPILEQIAKYAGQMAPQVYQWGMQQYANNQGNIDALLRRAQSYASPQQIASDMGMAEAGVQQSAEAARQNAIQDLQSYGIDPSSGRYAALDQASRVQAGAAAAGAGNQQRISDVATGNAMQNQAISASLQNVASGYGAANAANQFAQTGESLKYSPLGTQSSGSNYSSGQNSSQSSGSTPVFPPAGSQPASPGMGMGTLYGNIGLAAGGSVDDATTGGFVSNQLSPSNGNRTDDVPAQLNAGEFVIPKDVAAWKGQEFFYKLMAQARKMRATSGSGNDGQSEETTPTGYQSGGNVGGFQVQENLGGLSSNPTNLQASGQTRPWASLTPGSYGTEMPSWQASGGTSANSTPLPIGAQGMTGIPMPSNLTWGSQTSPGSYALPAGTANPWTAPAAAPGDWDWRSNLGGTASAPGTPRTDPTGFRGMNQLTSPNAQIGATPPATPRQGLGTGYFGNMGAGSPNQFKFGNLNPRYGAA
jgi:hypothetical protein